MYSIGADKSPRNSLISQNMSSAEGLNHPLLPLDGSNPAMKPRSKKSSPVDIAALRKYRGRIPADVDIVQLVREDRESGRTLVSKQSLALGAFLDEWEAQHGAFTTLELDRAVQDLESRRHAPRYHAGADVLADIPPPEIARKLFATDAPDRAGSQADSAPRFSDHMFSDLLSAAAHGVAARKILDNPRLIERARATLERWIAKQSPAPQVLLEWRCILAGTPQEIAAVALSLTSEATRLRSSSPLTGLLTKAEKAAIHASLGRPSKKRAK